MSYVSALLTLLCCVAVAAIVAWSERHPDRAIWPPRRFGWGARMVTWSVTIIAIGGAYMAGRLNWNAWHWPDWIRWYIGFSLVFVSSSVSSWAIIQLGLDQSMGADGNLVTTGPYARSRNPTYIANLALCGGWILLAASWPAAIAAGSLAALYIFAVPYEERWLARKYGAAYSEYRERVPRWL
ncbi:methyltransferase family protein [Oricola cellulosilytica]|uniref:Isoprenylcysteine carboxylmethyltransferase family protein n=1 Tax=Oricola cellulosilytica TaxID=1429082 RepID=A0A4R0PEG7_9HYPH|nr:isoprenylcysteine carboxylmethyltransferase family protein [Oricola cellulosilytica]TCD15018.1 isoprenylcysteine carboxylmethyltransferase family protein [Oricola cellulosilytica]